MVYTQAAGSSTRGRAGRPYLVRVAVMTASALSVSSVVGATGRPPVGLAVHSAGGSTSQLVSASRAVPDVAGEPIPFGRAPYFGAVAKRSLGSGVIGIAGGPSGLGYWIATANGGVFTFGRARFHGSITEPLKDHVAAIVATADGKGYWLACSRGGVFSFGGAKFHGSASGRDLSSPIVAMAATPAGLGYWLAASGGGVFTYGDAHFYGSATDDHLRDHIVAMAVTPDGHGYWLVASGGGVFTYGDAHFYGSASSEALKNPIVAAAATPDGRGYWLLPTTPPPPVGLPPPGKGFVAGHVTSIGDSVMLDTQPDLVADIPGIDVEAAVSRQWDQGVALCQQLKSEDRLGAIVVIDLGTNGPVTPQQFTNMMNVLAGASRVVFVTVHLPPSYSWWQSVNQTLEQGVPKYAIDQLADFNMLADENPQWFGPDGVHMPIGGVGAQAMAKLIKSKI
ncbi:MAG TPA: hypothetical protein VK217_04355 [Acidimicrobiales bacterium]|nr:hypothetical protein [Acidimicrobiales bacterium]